MILPTGQFRFVFYPKDYAATYAFYRSGLGLSVDHEWDYGAGDCGVVFFAASGMIELLSLAPDSEYVKPQGIQMLIEVDDVDLWFRMSQERGLQILQEPVTYPWGHRVLRLKDPDGVVVSLFSAVPAH